MDMQQLVLVRFLSFVEFGLYPDRDAIEAYEVMSQEVIQVWNALAHYKNLKVLKKLVITCS